MPSLPGKDSNGYYYRWGKSGKKYYYKKGDKASETRAKKLADKQGAAAYASGYKGNNMLQRIKVNLTGNVRHDSMEGIDYLVAPMVMLVEGVHEGSGGPLLYPAEELVKTPQVWNHKPVVVYHPQHNGQPISACDPIVLNNRKVGIIMNTTVGEVTVKNNQGKDVKRPALKAEAWLQEDRMKKVDERIANAIEKKEIMELSTGLFTDNENMQGEWEGEKYDAIARNYRPDHLALLPDLKGACSIEDGAGFLRLNAKRNKIDITSNAMSHGNIRSLLNSWLRDKDEDVWVEDVYDTFFIFMKDGKYFKGDYSIEDFSVKVSETFTEVVRVSEWRTLNGDFVGNGNEKEEIVIENVEEGIDIVLNPGVDVTDAYIRIRQKSPGSFKEDSMKTVWLSKPKGINSIQGKLKKPPKGKEGSMTIQSYLFVKSKWTVSKARAWVKEHKGIIMKNDRKENVMEKEKVIDALIASNTNSWKEEDRDTLMEMEDSILERMQEGDNAAKAAVENAAKKGAEEAKASLTNNQETKTEEKKETSTDSDEKKTQDKVENKKPQTAEEYIAEAPSEIQNVMNGMLDNYKALKTNLIKRITDSEQNIFSKEELQSKEVPELKKLAALLPGKKEDATSLGMNFSGQGDVSDITDNKVEPLVVPAVVNREIKKAAS